MGTITNQSYNQDKFNRDWEFQFLLENLITNQIYII
jgi:hypothetical protein